MVQGSAWSRIKGAASSVGSAIVDVAEAGWDALVDKFWALVSSIAPAAEPYLRNPGKLWDDIKAAIRRHRRPHSGSLLGTLQQGGIFGAVGGFFRNLIPAIQRIRQGIGRKNDHAALVAGVRAAIDAFSQMTDTILAPIKSVFSKVAGGLKKAFDAVALPIIDLVKTVAKSVWNTIEWVADGIVSIARKVGSTLGKVWSWIKNKLGFGGDSSWKASGTGSSVGPASSGRPPSQHC